MTLADSTEARWADDGGAPTDLLPPEAPMVDILGPLDALHARHEAMAQGRAPGDSTAVHHAILDRLAANRLVAESHGWSALALERVAGMGRLRLLGIPPAGDTRAVVPDWAPRRD